MISSQKISSTMLSQQSSLSPATSGSNLSSKVDHFTRWRPGFHLIAPKNWMNDPCGPCFDPSTGLFNVLYQYNPYGATWGNMTWMHATSKNLVHWKHIAQEPSLVPSLPHDQAGIFSGAMLLQGPKGEKGMLTAIYTAISQLPIHFTKPYIWGSEKLAMAVSADGGKTWNRDSSSLILSAPPRQYHGQVIGWRDPFIAAWPEMDIQLGLEQGKQLYGLISGGFKDKTPTAFLYRIDCNNLQKWTFISHVADVGLNYSLSSKSGDMGQNWEVCNFFSLQDQQFLIMNVEGVGEFKKARHAMWSNVELNGTQLTPKKSGLIDHGCLYAVTTFLHGPSQRRLLWGWITEDDLDESRYQQQGWSGCMSLPREMLLLTYTGIDKSVASDVNITSAFQVEEEIGKKSLQLKTLGWRPAEEMRALREGAKYLILEQPSAIKLPIVCRNFEIQLDISVSAEVNEQHQAQIGMLVCHNISLSQYTKIVYFADAIHVIRSSSSMDPDVAKTTLVAPLKLLPYADGSLERIRLKIFLDNSVLEIFINDRVAITSRIYCDEIDCHHVSLFNSEPKVAQFNRLEAWTGLQPAMTDTIINQTCSNPHKL